MCTCDQNTWVGEQAKTKKVLKVQYKVSFVLEWVGGEMGGHHSSFSQVSWFCTTIPRLDLMECSW